MRESKAAGGQSVTRLFEPLQDSVPGVLGIACFPFFPDIADVVVAVAEERAGMFRGESACCVEGLSVQIQIVLLPPVVHEIAHTDNLVAGRFGEYFFCPVKDPGFQMNIGNDQYATHALRH